MTRQEITETGELARDELEALVRFCQRHNKPWPPRMNIARRFKMTSGRIDYYMNELIKAGRVRRVGVRHFEVPSLPPSGGVQ